ncbi:MAG: nucleoside hydrolase [Oscillospiraceae bacterium]|nr:nucleoside hydrolase [Oscillospiraceae bacterium]
MIKTELILNLDTGIDDAYTIMLATMAESIDLSAIVTSYGNRSLETTTENTLRIVQLMGKNTPVVIGKSEPLFANTRVEFRGSAAHGDDGLGNRAGLLPYATLKPVEISATEYMAKILADSRGEVIIVNTAPLTNIALLLLAHPELKDKIATIVISGGAIERGNILPTVEANIFADPEAAQVVIQSGVKLTICPLDTGDKAYSTFEDRERFRLASNRTARFLGEVVRHYADHYENLLGREGSPLHDVVPMAWVLNPKLVETTPCYVEVDLTGYYTKGALMIDRLKLLQKESNASVAVSVDREGINQLIYESLRRAR